MDSRSKGQMQNYKTLRGDSVQVGSTIRGQILIIVNFMCIALEVPCIRKVCLEKKTFFFQSDTSKCLPTRLTILKIKIKKGSKYIRELFQVAIGRLHVTIP